MTATRAAGPVLRATADEAPAAVAGPARSDLLDRLAAVERLADERRRLLQHLSSVQRLIAHRAPVQEVLDATTAAAADLIEGEVVGLRLLQEDDPGTWELVSTVGVTPEQLEAARTGRVGDSIGGRCIAEGRLVVTGCYADEPDRLRTFAAGGLRAAMAAPVRRGDAVVGSLVVATARAGRTYAPAEQDLLSTFADHISLALNDAATVKALRVALDAAVDRATTDPLTELPNRAGVLARLDEALAEDRRPSVLFVDLDRFKEVNDALGHAAGDEVLRITARRLRRTCGDLHVGRLAGDEFVVVVPEERGAAALAARVRAALSLPIVVGARQPTTSLRASIGIATTAPGMDAEALLSDADLAMDRAKQQGRDRVVVFDRAMREERVRRIADERALVEALARDELEVHHQPCVRLSDLGLCGVEGLVRWRHPERGLLGPAAFIPLAEELGLIRAIDAQVLRRSLADLAGWSADHPELAHLEVAVNVSGITFIDPALPDVVEAALAEAGVAADRLTIEITETVVLEDVVAAAATCDRLRELGVKLALDDFGTGYSSLGYLKRLPVGTVKVDRSFVDGLGSERDDEVIVSAVTGLARAMGLDVVAEGIETPVQLAGVMRLGCDRAQGFLFARPCPPDAVVPQLLALARAPLGSR